MSTTTSCCTTDDNSPCASRCIIRQLVYKYSLIDAYPDNLLVTGRGQQQQQQQRGGEEEEDFDTKCTTTQQQLPLRFKKKEDQDVFIFKAIMHNIRPETIALIWGEEYYRKILQDATITVSSSGSNVVGSATLSSSTAALTTTTTTKKKTVQFAQNERGDIAVDIQFFEKSGSRELWWSPKEVSIIRDNCSEVVERFVSYAEYDSDEYVDTLSTILHPNFSMSTDYETNKTENKIIWDVLQENYDARGFEHQIVCDMRMLCKIHVRNVVLEAHRLQEEYNERKQNGNNKKKEEDDEDDDDELVRQTSLETSRKSRFLAQKLAEVDRIVSQQIHDEEEDVASSNTTITTTTTAAAASPSVLGDHSVDTNTTTSVPPPPPLPSMMNHSTTPTSRSTKFISSLWLYNQCILSNMIYSSWLLLLCFMLWCSSLTLLSSLSLSSLSRDAVTATTKNTSTAAQAKTTTTVNHNTISRTTRPSSTRMTTTYITSWIARNITTEAIFSTLLLCLLWWM